MILVSDDSKGPGGGRYSPLWEQALSCDQSPPRDIPSIVLPYDGKRAGDARRCYLKPDFLPQDRPYWRAREAGDL